MTARKNAFLRKKFLGVGASLHPQIWGPPKFSTFRWHLNIVWKFRRDRLPQSRITRLRTSSLLIHYKGLDGTVSAANLQENVNFRDFETYAKNDWQQLGN